MIDHLRRAAHELADFNRNDARNPITPDEAAEAGELLARIVSGLGDIVTELDRDVDELPKRFKLSASSGEATKIVDEAALGLDDLDSLLDLASKAVDRYRSQIRAVTSSGPRPYVEGADDED